jgi:DNA-binding MarR family transcriptional regulator
VGVPQVGQSYRGVDGHLGYLLRQAWRTWLTALELALRPHGLTAPQYGVLSVLARSPGASNADLARACTTTPQAMNGVLATLERASMIERRAHPNHGRILQVMLTDEGRRHLKAARPSVLALERTAEHGYSADEMATVRTWLVTTGQRLEHLPQSRLDARAQHDELGSREGFEFDPGGDFA